MAIEVTGDKGCAEIVISGAMTIYEAAEMQQALLACFDAYQKMAVNLEGVTECDAAGIQLLCSCRLTATEQQKEWQIQGVSEVLEKWMKIGGIDLQAEANALNGGGCEQSDHDS